MVALAYLFIFIFERSHIDWPIINALETHWALPNRSTSLDPKSQIKKTVLHYGAPFQFIYMGLELWANYMG
jgi:hypothetical protein